MHIEKSQSNRKAGKIWYLYESGNKSLKDYNTDRDALIKYSSSVIEIHQNDNK